MDGEKIFDKFTRNARRVILSSYEIARKDPQNYASLIEPRHLFAAMLYEKTNLAARLLEKLNVDLVKTADAVAGELAETYVKPALLPSEDYKRILGESFFEAAQLGHVYIGSEHILLALMKFEHLPFVDDLVKSGLSYEQIRDELLSFGSYQPGVFSKSGAPGNNTVHNGVTPDGNEPGALDFFGRNMNQLAEEEKYLPILGREKEIERIIHILSRQTKNNPILVGESGVGKTAVIEGLVQRIVKGDVPELFKNVEIIQIDVAAIIAGAKIRGDVEERLLSILNEVQKSPNKIIFIDEIHTIVGSGSAGGGSDIANVLKPYLTGSDLRVIGATTRDEYRRYFEEDGALARRFQPVNIEELDVDSSIQVLKYLRPTFEKYHHVKITDEAIVDAVKLSERYVSDRYLPDKAIDLIDEAAAKKKIIRDQKDSQARTLESDISQIKQDKGKALSDGNLDLAGDLRIEELNLQGKIDRLKKRGQKISLKYKVESEDIRGIISSWTKIPVNSLSVMDVKSIAGMETVLKQRIIGQEDAVIRVAAALKRAKLGLTDASRPLASFLFLGPTGVGKTETAKVIAKEIFGTADALIQINMSEMMEQHSVSKIIGAPPGYVGYQDGNNITEQIRQRPYSVVLFDEIEKAHVDLLNILLQILEEGFVQDSKGRVVSFKNTVIIMTSNIGAESIAQDSVLGFDVNISKKDEEKIEDFYDDMRERVMGDLKDYLRPEFINRVDEIIVYRGLNETDAEKIAKLQIDALNERLREKHILLKVTGPVIAKIAEEGFSKEYGARNVKRKVQEQLENELADYLLAADLVPELQQRQKKKQPLLQLTANLKSDKVMFSAR